VSTLKAGLVASALKELSLHVVEEGGPNRGVKVEAYQRAAGLKPGDPWCAAFVAWNVATAKGVAKAPSWTSGSAITTWHRGSRGLAAGDKATPLEGDALPAKVAPGWVWVRATTAKSADAARKGGWVRGHCGIVVAVDAVGFHTVEGNTNKAGSREGDGVWRKLHKWSDAALIGRTVGWFDPDATEAAAAAPKA
jgi:hypothetical protein